MGWGIKTKIRKLYKQGQNQIFSLANTIIKPVGLNIGGGHWNKLGWINLDSLHAASAEKKIKLDENTRLNFADQKFKYVFSSHFFEHVNDLTVANLFKESYRILKPGGYFRIIVPDFELAFKKYHERDQRFFDDIWDMKVRYENWQQHKVELTLENKLSYIFCAYENIDSQGLFPAWRTLPHYYSGPVQVKQSELKEKINQLNIHDFSDWLLTKVPSDANELGHINAFDFNKFKNMLTQAGFSEVYLSGYQQSKAAEFLKEGFDNRPEFSLFVEARK